MKRKANQKKINHKKKKKNKNKNKKNKMKFNKYHKLIKIAEMKQNLFKK